MTCRDRNCTSKSHHQTLKLQCISNPFMVLATAQLPNIPPGKDMNSAYYSTIFLAGMFACDDQVACILLRTDSCAINCTHRLLAEAARMPKIATDRLVHVFVRNRRYFCPCPSRFRALVYVGAFVGIASSPDALVRRPHVSASEVLN